MTHHVNCSHYDAPVGSTVAYVLVSLAFSVALLLATGIPLIFPGLFFAALYALAWVIRRGD